MVPFDETAWDALLTQAMAAGASDIHLAAETPAYFRVAGTLQKCPDTFVSAAAMDKLLERLLSPHQQQRYRERQEVDFAFTQGGQRYRVNAFQQRTGPALALRLIPARIPGLEELGTPAVLQKYLQEEAGLFLVTGRAGSGKTTTLAAYLDAVNQTRAAHIITLEDPVEYVHVSQRSLVSQRELDTDFSSFAGALRSALREDPDILLVGELRDADTIMTALSAAETGHLVLASLHTQTAAEAVLRIESFFPPEQQLRVRYQLAAVLGLIVSQRLLPAAGGGRVCAAEVLAATAAVRNLIRQGKVQQLPSAMLSGAEQGMVTMNRAVEQLRVAGRITGDTASRYIT
ncbi:MAG: PilT/PilU family type 4a pilus ATPase [Schwartzia sp.]|nr:PilT/PilU family type 4a pilus ATPase [Schwartzia sp. (in: firmicutes)]